MSHTMGSVMKRDVPSVSDRKGHKGRPNSALFYSERDVPPVSMTYFLTASMKLASNVVKHPDYPAYRQLLEKRVE